jgi:hypothetical protein
VAILRLRIPHSLIDDAEHEAAHKVATELPGRTPLGISTITPELREGLEGPHRSSRTELPDHWVMFRLSRDGEWRTSFSDLTTQSASAAHETL